MSSASFLMSSAVHMEDISLDQWNAVSKDVKAVFLDMYADW